MKALFALKYICSNQMMRRLIYFLMIVAAGTGVFLFFAKSNDVKIGDFIKTAEIGEKIEDTANIAFSKGVVDIELQKPLENPPAVIKAIYSTGWSAGSDKKVNYFIDLAKTTELNAVVIDVKDYSGTLSYKTDISDANKYNATEVKILKPNALIKKLHDNNIYAIARVTVFQDPILAKARPDLALTSSSTGKQWKDNKGLMWVDPASKEAWDYNIAIAKDALSRGFDEVNFDYVRFPTDGKTSDIIFPFWDGKTLMHKIIKNFFQHLREAMPDAKLSADLFGLTTIHEDIGVGQVIEDAYIYFDAVAPMVYPSHYAPGFLNYKNPSVHPYEVVYNSISTAQQRLDDLIKTASTTLVRGKLRPWLQDFDMGADYTADMVRAQIKATEEGVMCNQLTATTTNQSTCGQTGKFDGWMIWNPSNIYTRDAFNNE